MRIAPITMTALATVFLAVGCASGEPGTQVGETKEAVVRGKLGKADLYGACAAPDSLGTQEGAYCGGKSTGSCHCDEACLTFGDCCSDFRDACKPDNTECAGIQGSECNSRQICIDDPTDSCDSKAGGTDCSGVCVDKISCGGVAGAQCPTGLVCVDDSSDGCDISSGENDCSGICRTPSSCDASKFCAQVSSCIGGKRYPTACGPSNCDAPTGDC